MQQAMGHPMGPGAMQMGPGMQMGHPGFPPGMGMPPGMNMGPLGMLGPPGGPGMGHPGAPPSALALMPPGAPGGPGGPGGGGPPGPEQGGRQSELQRASALSSNPGSSLYPDHDRRNSSSPGSPLDVKTDLDAQNNRFGGEKIGRPSDSTRDHFSLINELCKLIDRSIY